MGAFSLHAILYVVGMIVLGFVFVAAVAYIVVDIVWRSRG